MASWQIVNNELIPIGCSEPAHFVNPTPIGLWEVIDNTLTPTDYTKPKGFVNPTPISMWSVQNGVLTNGAAEPPKWGAFVNSNVTVITIPISVKEIGEFAFHNTKLKEVCISRYCGRYDTSFPKDCKISYYEGEAGDCMLYDSSDYLLLDNTGAMILVRGD